MATPLSIRDVYLKEKKRLPGFSPVKDKLGRQTQMASAGRLFMNPGIALNDFLE